jgi:hypothetical protein
MQKHKVGSYLRILPPTGGTCGTLGSKPLKLNSVFLNTPTSIHPKLGIDMRSKISKFAVSKDSA